MDENAEDLQIDKNREKHRSKFVDHCLINKN